MSMGRTQRWSWSRTRAQKLDGQRPQLGIFFAAIDYGAEVMLAELMDAFPGLEGKAGNLVVDGKHAQPAIAIRSWGIRPKSNTPLR